MTGHRGSAFWRRPAPRGLPALAGGLVGASLLVLLHVPAGGIVGAVAGSALASGVRGCTPPSFAVRMVGMVLLGCAAGARLEWATLQSLLHLALPILLAVAVLLAVDVALAAVLTRWYGVDPVTALLACAPGGVGEMTMLALDMQARTEIVVAVHVVRVVTVVLVAMPLLLLVLGHP
ncbi:MAG TPA: AbrB family transcriptional regulator [Nocardioidaceae bacterium]|nr:AbrB family transcriptional regulator [Nocardioidaceae bacterium]